MLGSSFTFSVVVERREQEDRVKDTAPLRITIVLVYSAYYIERGRERASEGKKRVKGSRGGGIGMQRR